MPSITAQWIAEPLYTHILLCQNLEPHYVPLVHVVPLPLIRGEIVHLTAWKEESPFPLPPAGVSHESQPTSVWSQFAPLRKPDIKRLGGSAHTCTMSRSASEKQVG